VPQIAAVLLTLSIVSCLFIPAQSITVRTLIPTKELLKANAMLSQAFYLIRIVSPLVAGALVAWLGAKATFSTSTQGSFFSSAIMISTLTIKRPARERHGQDAGRPRPRLRGRESLPSSRHSGLSFVFLAMAVAMFVAMSSFSPLHLDLRP